MTRGDCRSRRKSDLVGSRRKLDLVGGRRGY